MEISSFFNFTNVPQTFAFKKFVKLYVWLITFLVHFLQLFQRIRNQHEILRFDIFFRFFSRRILGSFYHFLKTLKPNVQKTDQRIKKRIL
jgi:hypothetical protein